MGLTNQNITINLHSVVKQMKKQIFLDWKQNKASSALTSSSALIAKRTIKQTLMFTCSGDTNSITIGIAKNNKNYIRTGVNQFT